MGRTKALKFWFYKTPPTLASTSEELVPSSRKPQSVAKNSLPSSL